MISFDHDPIFHDSHGDACARCDTPLAWVGKEWKHTIPAAECHHPAAALLDHYDNPSRYRCGLCNTQFVDYGNGSRRR